MRPLVLTALLTLAGTALAQDGNPRRGAADAVRDGHALYHQHCARCHGANAVGKGEAAPDLRQLDRYCRRIAQADIRAACVRDNDVYFRLSVLKGKTKVGVEHMPPWDGVLDQDSIWAIKSYVESLSGDWR